jgi:hypothetical protein
VRWASFAAFCLLAPGPAFGGNPFFSSLSPASGSSAVGVPVTFTLTVGHTDGPASLQFAQLLVNGPLNGSGGCYLLYDRPSNSVILGYPDGAGWLVPGSGQTATNSRCTLYASGSSVEFIGNTMKVTWQVSFKDAVVGLHHLWTLACDTAGACAGWRDSGDYTVGFNSPPAYVSLTPVSGSGTAQSFTLTMSDANGRTIFSTFSCW